MRISFLLIIELTFVRDFNSVVVICYLLPVFWLALLVSCIHLLSSVCLLLVAGLLVIALSNISGTGTSIAV